MPLRGPTGFSISPATEVQTAGLNLDLSFTERRSQLTVLSGPQTGRSVEVNLSPKKTTFIVGKGEECDLVIADATVSRQHFVIEQQQGAYVIRDSGSTNGTWIDQFRIREAYLRPGVVLRAGQVQLKFEPLFKPIEIAPSRADKFGHLVGHSVRMRQVFTLLERVAKTEATVVIFGETGTGKSAIAQAIHEASARKGGPFITVDCGAIAENLIESELFGHEKGAFTGAASMRKGALERAHGGTLFIDELVDLRLDLQPRLLRVLEEREVRRVGGNDAIKLDVRIIAASRFDLWREVEAKKFREDLYFRLAVFTIPLPALRERKEDIALLAQAFLRARPGGEQLLARFTPDVLERLSNHPFPGNVRELRNVIERALHLDTIDASEMLGPGMISGQAGGPPAPSFASAPSSASFSSYSSASHTPAPQAPVALQPPGDRAALAPVAPFAPFSPIASKDSREETAALPQVELVGDGAVPLVADCTLPFKDAKERLLEQFEGEYFRRLIARSGGNASAIARTAGIDRKHVYTLAKKHNLDLKGKREVEDE